MAQKSHEALLKKMFRNVTANSTDQDEEAFTLKYKEEMDRLEDIQEAHALSRTREQFYVPYSS